MKDWFSLLLKVKGFAVQETREEPDFAEGCAAVLKHFQPFLQAAAETSGQTPQQLLAAALLKHLAPIGRALSDDKLPDLKPEVEFEVDSLKNDVREKEKDHLDKINDDCLGVVLSFLSFKDRCLAVERTSRRMLHLSRSAPIHCECVDSVLQMNFDRSLSVADITVISRRMRFAQISMQRPFDASWILGIDASEEQLDAILLRMFAECRTLFVSPKIFGEKRICKIADWQMPHLRRFVLTMDEAMSEVSVCKALWRLVEKNKSVIEVAFVGDFGSHNAWVFEALSALKRVKSLTMCPNTCANHWQLANECDFGHIKHLSVGDVSDAFFCVFWRLLRPSLESLEIRKNNLELFLEPVHFHKLKLLRFIGGIRADVLDDNLTRMISADAIEECFVENCAVSEISRFLEFYNARKLTFRIDHEYGYSLTQLDEELFDLRAFVLEKRMNAAIEHITFDISLLRSASAKPLLTLLKWFASFGHFLGPMQIVVGEAQCEQFEEAEDGCGLSDSILKALAPKLRVKKTF